MSDKYQFQPVRKRWFVQRQDYGRHWGVVPALEGEHGEIILGGIRYPTKDEYENTRLIFPIDCMTGWEPAGCFFLPADVQQLMDALWEAGLRPSRGL